MRHREIRIGFERLLEERSGLFRSRTIIFREPLLEESARLFYLGGES